MTLRLLKHAQFIHVPRIQFTTSPQQQFDSSLHFTIVVLSSYLRLDKRWVHDSDGNFGGPQDVTQ